MTMSAAATTAASGEVGQLESVALQRKAKLAALRAKRQNKGQGQEDGGKTGEPIELPK